MKHRPALACAAIGVVLAVSGCTTEPAPFTAAPTTSATTSSSAAAADTVTWGGTFCEGVTPALTGLGEIIKTAGSSSPTAQMNALAGHATTSATAMADTTKKLEVAGAPDAKTKALHEELVAFFGDNAKALTQVKEDLAKLNPTAPDFLQKVGVVADRAQLDKFQQQLGKYLTEPALQESFTKAPQCTAMTAKVTELGADLLGK
ncbi:hypothetical protein [Umezawaea sp. Da 62-37]|uniref:hypothetical protein n=1 Tax=Umezawaea sp. Da 62-37 TaxID=3075927 RepID=UPI0028F6FE1D|nr:hypothetical protein [Umezawaea sp. Da 62-37]WNV89663.1 hypothetical protein RM788_15575 [Umezawaea sp. Da 62-37]